MKEGQKLTNTGKENRRMKNKRRGRKNRQRDEGRDFSSKFDWRQYSKP